MDLTMVGRGSMRDIICTTKRVWFDLEQEKNGKEEKSRVESEI